jgi:hypothetical protein
MSVALHVRGTGQDIGDLSQSLADLAQCVQGSVEVGQQVLRKGRVLALVPGITCCSFSFALLGVAMIATSGIAVLAERPIIRSLSCLSCLILGCRLHEPCSLAHDDAERYDAYSGIGVPHATEAPPPVQWTHRWRWERPLLFPE